MLGGAREALLCFVESMGGRQRFRGDERRLQRIHRRRASLEDLVGQRNCFVHVAPLQGEAGDQNSNRPLVPLARLSPIRAVGFAGAAQIVAGEVVSPANQLDLREGVENGAGGLVELNGATYLERTMQ